MSRDKEDKHYHALRSDRSDDLHAVVSSHRNSCHGCGTPAKARWILPSTKSIKKPGRVANIVSRLRFLDVQCLQKSRTGATEARPCRHILPCERDGGNMPRELRLYPGAITP